MNYEEEVEPPQKKKTKFLPLSLSSLPDEIIVNCFARISRSEYLSLSLVSKTFHSLISSKDLYSERSQMGTTETCLYICLRYSTEPNTVPTRCWFSLWLNLFRHLIDVRVKDKSSGSLFVPCVRPPPTYSSATVTIGSEIYVIGGPMEDKFTPSSAVRVYDFRTRTWRDLPNMKMERIFASACVLDGKIYVMGGCSGWFEGISWFEMFDIKTQTWKTLQAFPDIKLRLGCGVQKINVVEGKIYVKTTEPELSDGIYDVKEGRWSVADGSLSLLWSNSWCVIENVLYCFSISSSIMWYDLEAGTWRDVRGLKSLKKYRSLSNDYRNCMVELVNYGGKLAILWDRFERPGRSQNKNIWCAMVTLIKCGGGAIAGKIEWVNVVLTVPRTYTFVRCLALSI